MKYIPVFFIFTFLVSCKPASDQNKEPEVISKQYSWALLPFTKADEANPILLADTNSIFHCPVRNADVQWEEKDVFNPAAVVRHDTVFLLYRAEDSIGKFAGT